MKGVEGIKVLSLSHILYVNREEAEKLTNFPDSHEKKKNFNFSFETRTKNINNYRWSGRITNI